MRQKWLTMSIALMFFTIVGLDVQAVHASTTVNYSSPCKYFNTNGDLQISTTCRINFGTLGAAGGARFTVTFPNKAEVVIYVYKNGKAETNKIRSEVAIAGGNVVVATNEGEIFIFKNYNLKR